MSDDNDDLKPSERKGALAWMTKNSVAANILMICLLVGGFLKLKEIKQEVFPSFTLDKIVVQIPYPSSSNPADIRDNIIKPAEPELASIDGVERIVAQAREGVGVITVDLALGSDTNQAENDIRSAMNRVSMPKEARENMVVARGKNDIQVTSIVIHGSVDAATPEESLERSRKVLKTLAERAKLDLERNDKVSRVKIQGLPASEISIEVPTKQLRKFGLTIPELAGRIEAASIEVPGGKIRSESGDINIQIREKRETGMGFSKLPILASSSGNTIKLEDILGAEGAVRDTFEDKGQTATFNGKPAVMLMVFQTGQEKPLEIAAEVELFQENLKKTLPPGFATSTWMDMSKMYEERIDLLLDNAVLGLVLVLLILGLFLEVKLAFWVTLGIPISFIGALLFLPSTGMSVNMLSLFAFIIVLGMVVDDAIIVGESIYTKRQQGMSAMRAAIVGVKEVATPVVFAILTTMIAYAPMLFIPGIMGKFFRVIPIVVITVLFISLVESLLILPAHLAHSKKNKKGGLFSKIDNVQGKFARRFEAFVAGPYARFLRRALANRYLVLACGFAILFLSFGLLGGGRVGGGPGEFPAIEDDTLIVAAEIAPGSSLKHAKRLERLMIDSVTKILDDNGGFDENVNGLYSQVGISTLAKLRNPDQSGPAKAGGQIVEAAIYMRPLGERKIRPSKVATMWNEQLKDFPGLVKLKFMNDAGPAAGSDIDITLRHWDMEVLKSAGEELAETIAGFTGTREIEDGHVDGAPQISLELTPIAIQQGMSAQDVGSQIRGSFYGIELEQSIPRGDEDVKVFVRLPRNERRSEQDIENLLLRSRMGGEIPLFAAATPTRDRGYTAIRRIDGVNTLSVKAMVDSAQNDKVKIVDELFKNALPKLAKKFEGLTFNMGGPSRENQRTQGSLNTGFLMALIGIFALIAIPLKSYSQPILIMFAIPFGFVGAIFGHLLMGYEYSIMSTMGIVALAGVVVNDSLILIVGINRLREDGPLLHEAVVKGACSRFRPILLTSLTTFFGLAPMILETSMQARFLIPMAISLGFGVIFATFITLLLIPALYIALEDVKALVAKLRS